MGNWIKTMFFLTILTGLFIFIGGLVGGRSGMMFAFILAVCLNFFSYWFSSTIVLKMYGAKEVNESEAPELHAIIRELALEANIPEPKICIMQNDSPNAFATGRNPENAVVAVTTGILKLLSREELKGVLAHETGHILNRDILIGSVAATIAGAIMMLASMARWAAIFGGFRSDDDEGGGLFGLLIAMFIAPLAAVLIQMAISRSREYLADKTGAKLCRNPHSLADALRKLHQYSRRLPMKNASPQTAHMFIVNPLSGRRLFSNLFSTHPDMQSRIEKLESMTMV